MIDLKRCNYITGDPTSVSFGVNEIIKFLELAGRNIVLITKPKSSGHSTPLKYFINNKLEYRGYDDFKILVNNSSNLFRVDLIVVDLWDSSVSGIIEYKSVLDTLDIDYIILAKEYHYKDSDDVTDYHIKRNSRIKYSSSIPLEDEYIITNKISGWSADFGSLIKSYIRNKKIDGIIGEV